MATLKRDFRPEEVDEWPVLLIHRKDLLAELLRVAQTPDVPKWGPPVVIHNSSKVVSIVRFLFFCLLCEWMITCITLQDCYKGLVELKNGQQLSADVVIGADGVHSVLRSEVVGFESPGCYSGEATYRALVETHVAFEDPVRKSLTTSFALLILHFFNLLPETQVMYRYEPLHYGTCDAIKSLM